MEKANRFQSDNILSRARIRSEHYGEEKNVCSAGIDHRFLGSPESTQLSRLIQYSKRFKKSKRYILRVLTPCSPLKTSRSFGGAYHLHLQGRITSKARNQHETGSKLSSACYLLHAGRLTFNGLQGVIFQKTEFYKTTVVRTSDPTNFIILRWLWIIGSHYVFPFVTYT
jgi:hypothetical protein